MKLLSLFFSVCITLPAAAQKEPLRVAILDFAVGTPKQSGGSTTGLSAPEAANNIGSEMAILLNAHLSASESLFLVERAELSKVLGEQELGLSGAVSSESAAKVGYLTGAKVLVTGRLFEASGKQFAVAKIIGTETGRVYGETVTYAGVDMLDAACTELASKIQTVIQKKGDTLAAAPEDPDAQVKRLRTLVEGKQLPSVAIDIPEHHFSHAIPDPAVETELRLILSQVGFRVIDTKTSSEKPAIEIRGEAFSELAGRRGNLISCRARVEVKVVQNSDGELLLSDRQAGGAVDLSENVAAKEALARAAKKLADRIVPKLVEK